MRSTINAWPPRTQTAETTTLLDNRRGGGGVFFQEADPIQLMFRGLAATSEGQPEAEMFIATIRWAVKERRAVRHQPQAVTEARWRVADAMEPMGAVLGTSNPPAHAVKLVLEILRTEPFDTPKWSGPPLAFPAWQLDLPAGIRRFRDVKTVEDYIRVTDATLGANRAARGMRIPPALLHPQIPEVEPHPVFGAITRREDSFDCFVLLPLNEPFRTVYEQAVEPVARELGMSCGHAEGIFGPGRIMDDIISAITFAKVIVAELTGRNPNVFYELGIAHHQGKQVVLMSQAMQDVPFDVRDRRVVVYHWDDAAPDAGEVRHRLRPHLEGALRAAEGGQGRTGDAPVSDLF